MDTLAQIIERSDAIERLLSDLTEVSRLQRARTMVLVNSLLERVDLYQQAFGSFTNDELRERGTERC